MLQATFSFVATTRAYRKTRSRTSRWVTALDKQVLTDRLRKIPRRRFALILSGIDAILGR